MENHTWTADNSKLKYSINIGVYDNCAGIKIELPKGREMPSYHEVIGAIQTQVLNLIAQQREENIKQLKKKKKNGK